MNLWAAVGVFILAWIASPSLANDDDWRGIKHGHRLIALAVLCAIPALLLGRGLA